MEAGERDNVYKVYDKIAGWYYENRYKRLIEKHHLDDFLGHLPVDASILDLGCGTGIPIMKYFIDNKLDVTGVDASSQMLEIAKKNFPSQTFILQDMRLLDLNQKFDGIIAWHSFFHLPAADQPQMFARFAQHLNPGGVLLFTSGTEHGEAWGMNGGENLFHASLSTVEYEKCFNDNDFQILNHMIKDPNCGEATIWMAKYNPFKYVQVPAGLNVYNKNAKIVY